MDINDIIGKDTKEAKIMLVVSLDDLKAFGESLIAATIDTMQQNNSPPKQADDGETFLTTNEVKNIFGVCDTTLYTWHKNGLLRHRKFGKRNMYAMSDIKRFMNDHVDTETVSGYAQWHNKVQKLST